MSLWSAIVAVVAISAWFVLRLARLKVESGAKSIDPQAIATIAELNHEIGDLRERVKVLERITTDANQLEVRQTRAIAAEIESLRDK